ncbi:MAG: lipoate--protein ligase family protein [Candidatus Omnitrophica bacterium]|nr:lipoate--protein ligase family protein [Candidatus Omnitrophota bacterium]
MRIVKYSCGNSEEMIALDEVLLDKAECGEIGETLRFWEAKDHFIVVGRAGKVQEDCFVSVCRRDRIKIIRRASGGGAVLQGPGCLNFSLVLSYEKDERYKKITDSYESILGSIAASFQKTGLNVEFFPTSDLALDGKKISGNAQARKRKFFLHHGTLLYDLDLPRVGKYLRHPAREPVYRLERPHKNFLTNIPVTPSVLCETIENVFTTGENEYSLRKEDMDQMRSLAISKYSKDDWNYVF